MNVQDILTLAKAGFTAEQISGMLQTEQPEPQPAPDPKPDPKPEPQPEPEAAPSNPDPYERLMEELGAIKSQIQKNNISGAQQPDSQELTGSQILANIIAPPKKGG